MSKERVDDLYEVTKPLMDYLKDNYHPHHTIILDSQRVELLESQMGAPRKKKGVNDATSD